MDPDGRVTLQLTADEAMLVVSALRQFEPYWPADLDDSSRTRLLALVRSSIDHLVGSLSPV